MVLANQIDNLSARRWEVDVPNIQRMPEFWEIANHPRYHCTIWTKVRQTRSVWKVFFEHKQYVASQDFLLANGKRPMRMLTTSNSIVIYANR
jgi:hypothetical protein